MKRPTENKASQFHDPEPVKEPAHAEEQLAQHNNKCKQHRPQPDPEDPRRKKIENFKQKQKKAFFFFKKALSLAGEKGIAISSVPDPDPLVRGSDPNPIPSFHHHAKRVRKTLISTVL
jgi:hypothetical protein